jgi:hypothetical protein
MPGGAIIMPNEPFAHGLKILKKLQDFVQVGSKLFIDWRLCRLGETPGFVGFNPTTTAPAVWL